MARKTTGQPASWQGHGQPRSAAHALDHREGLPHLSGTVVAAVSLAGAGPAESIRERNAAISKAMQDAAGVLGNTPTIARKSYVDPRVLDCFIAGETIGMTRRTSGEGALRSLLVS